MVREQKKTLMFQEAAEVANAVKCYLSASPAGLDNLALKIAQLEPRFVVTCARGSSDHAATFAKYLIERTLGCSVSSFAPSIASIYKAPMNLEKTLYLTISQSGGSPDIVEAARFARKKGAFTVAFVNVEDSPLAKICEYVVPLHAGQEKSVAATKSYILSLVAILDLVERIAGLPKLRLALKQLPDLLQQAWCYDTSSAVSMLKDAKSLFVVSRGAGLGIAAEAALKFKETCAIHAEAFSAAEVRHGPMALVDRNFPVLLFSAENEPDVGVQEIGTDFLSRGSNLISFGAPLEGALCVPAPKCDDPYVDFICQIQSFYRLVNDVSLARGLDPDQPPHLKKMTRTR